MDLADFDALMHIIGNHPSLQRKAEMALRSDIVACCPRTIVAVTLMYLGGQSNICIADQFGLHHDTVPQLARLGVRAILDNEQQFIDPTPFASPQKLQKLATGFNKRTYKYDEGVRTMQGCVGALDGIVIRMLKPDVPEHGRFRSRKGYHALTFQCMCDADHVFTFVSDWFYGSTSDSSAFKDTALYHAIYDKKVLVFEGARTQDAAKKPVIFIGKKLEIQYCIDVELAFSGQSFAQVPAFFDNTDFCGVCIITTMTTMFDIIIVRSAVVRVVF
ncbi:Protein ALP1-like [Hondaea fermentalgiana]|uniref:Protein ALP1-like n=1 Tax=Hondaea fermentalgiana TaxID=2315210 RepID=A0A2R5GIS6_9STRA|nr:Protein ALP1-like [Hondaea fermentalgiana]|eukprot:GBG30792.1 Protein ALP1-like [Hondaea fermentalgiana]